ncbi:MULTISPECIES: hypothetical protein [Butyricimonas]|uniref:hypothetical protein n=1 Tax=Butyricimonas TaxID=574697 RepID=UPI0007FB2E33|nr:MULTISPECIES: hypothetical protein [Butyricimonas]
MKILFTLFICTFICCNSFSQTKKELQVENTKLKHQVDSLTKVITSQTKIINDFKIEVTNLKALFEKIDKILGVTVTSTTNTPATMPQTTSPSYKSDNSSRVIHTGPRGGKYYINKNGKKTYVKKK